MQRLNLHVLTVPGDSAVIGLPEEPWRQLREPPRVDGKHFTHVLLRSQYQIVIQRPLGLLVEEARARMNVHWLLFYLHSFRSPLSCAGNNSHLKHALVAAHGHKAAARGRTIVLYPSCASLRAAWKKYPDAMALQIRE